MKWKLILGIIGVFAVLSILGSASTHQQVAGVQTSITPTNKPTLIPSNTQTPTATTTPTPTDVPTPTYIYVPPTATPTPYVDTTTSTSDDTQTQSTQQVCVGATALCADGTCSYAAHHQGACSHHGGVAQWYQ